MTSTLLEFRTLPASRLRLRVCVATVLVCLPYLTLKTAWILGVPIGSDEASFASDTRGANLITAGMELVAIGMFVVSLAVTWLLPKRAREGASAH